MSVLQVGAGGYLNVFELIGNEHAAAKPEMFSRGHIDHVGIDAADEAAFFELRRRLLARGACTEAITDFGSQISFMFIDPDGMEGEICLVVDAAAESHEPRPYRIPAHVG
jgi:hypothetical protein